MLLLLLTPEVCASGQITPHLIKRDARAEVVDATEHEIHRAANLGARGDLPVQAYTPVYGQEATVGLR